MNNASRESMKTYAVNMCNSAERLLHFLSQPTMYEDINAEHIAYLRGVANALASLVRYEDLHDGSMQG